MHSQTRKAFHEAILTLNREPNSLDVAFLFEHSTWSSKPPPPSMSLQFGARPVASCAIVTVSWLLRTPSRNGGAKQRILGSNISAR
jgi:hypothetical protein